jgi:hypothetical protein
MILIHARAVYAPLRFFECDLDKSRDFTGFPPLVALTTEYRIILSHFINARLPVLDLMYASRSFTLLKKRAVFLFLFSTSHPSAWKL